MKPAAFEYAAPDTLDEALRLRSEWADRPAVVLAGGQSLVPALNLRFARPGAVLDLNRVAGLGAIQQRGEGLSLGALVHQREAERSALVLEHAAVLAEALAHVAHPAIRNRGTVCGSIAHADPAAEIPAVMTLLGAQLVLRSVRGERLVGAAEYATGPYMTALEPDEILVEARVPTATAGTAFLEVARRPGDFALVAVAAFVARSQGRITEARLVFAGVGPAAERAEAAEAALVGEEVAAETFAAAAENAAAELRPPSDHHASAAYRRRVAAVVAAQALTLAASRAPDG